MRHRLLHARAALALVFLVSCGIAGRAGFAESRRADRGSPITSAEEPSAPAAAKAARAIAPSELVLVVKVVDGDTLHVRRKGRIEKLRLLGVDTEERLRSGSPPSPTKPETVFGEECALWAQAFFAGLATESSPPRVGLLFPGGVEKRDVYGRLLCHVILPDGRDYNRMLVELGKSPYFNKYGNDEVDHAGFVAAQARARESGLGIWSARTNEPVEPGAPAAKRPYRELLAWWDARARAVDDFRARRERDPGAVVDAEDPAALARAAEAGSEVEVFGEVDELFEETPRGARAAPSSSATGDLTVLLRTSSRERAVRVRIPAFARPRFEALDLTATTRSFRQNYVLVRGTLRAGARGFDLRCEDPRRFRRAGPEPAPVDGGAR